MKEALPVTEIDDLLDYDQTESTESQSVAPSTSGTALVLSDISGRLQPALYASLRDGNDDNVTKACTRGTLMAASLMSRSGISLDLDNLGHREIACQYSIYELFLALGIKDAGKEYREKGKNLIVALGGTIPESANPESVRTPVMALARPGKLKC